MANGEVMQYAQQSESKAMTTFGGYEGVSVEAVRAAKEVEGAIILAKRFPRDINRAYTQIVESCKRPKLAGQAMYAYPRGGELVTGPSIRLAEACAQNWGNLQFGIKEISQENGESVVESYCWDLETNVKQSKIFTVPHVRYSKKNGMVTLTDPRDIYEMVANQGARRLRACILGVIPGDIIEAAVEECEKTLAKKDGKDVPLADRIRQMVVAFKDLGVTQDMLEKRLGHKIDVTIPAEIVTLQKIFISLKDGMAKREDYFEITQEKREELRKEAEEQAKHAAMEREISQRVNAIKVLEDTIIEAQKKGFTIEEIETEFGISIEKLKEEDLRKIWNVIEALRDVPAKATSEKKTEVKEPKPERLGSDAAHKIVDKCLMDSTLADWLRESLVKLQTVRLEVGDNVTLAKAVRLAKEGRRADFDEFYKTRTGQ